MVGIKHAFVAATLATAAVARISKHKDTTWKSNIKNVVVLVQENRSFDTFAGGLSYSSDINGLLHTNYCNSMNITNPNEMDDVCAGPRANDVASDDPNHSITGVNMQLFGTYEPAATVDTYDESMRGFVTEQSFTFDTENKTRVAEAINYYTPAQIPVFNSLAENFVLFDRWFASVPGPTNPNRAYITSGTSYGHGKNDVAFTTYGLPQKSIFQQLSEANITWTNYYNSSFNPDSEFYSWTKSSGANKKNVIPIAQFYEDAKNGKLPTFTYINPECCNYQSFHPPSPITLGEEWVKGIYEALRNGPQWKNTLFILTFDEHGGFGDHVPPPTGVPAGDSKTYSEKDANGNTYTFDFTRLGVRVPTVLISPWVGKGLVEHAGSNNGGEYTHTSILGFLAELWGLDILTPRVGYSATFEHLITNTFRSDTPTTLPNAAQF